MSGLLPMPVPTGAVDPTGFVGSTGGSIASIVIDSIESVKSIDSIESMGRLTIAA